MNILGGFPVFNFLSSQSKSDRLCKSIGPLSFAIKRQAFSTTAQRQIPKSANYNSNYKQQQQQQQQNVSGPEVVTENSVLNNFPRPNLKPTLHFSLFGYNNNEGVKTTFTQCQNCFGPHSTDFCPC